MGSLIVCCVPLFFLLVLPLCPSLLLLVVLPLCPRLVVLPHFIDAVAALALVTLIAVAAKPLGQQLEIVLRVPPCHSKVTVAGGTYAVTAFVQVEVMWGVGVTADAAPIPLAQEVAADLGSSGHIEDVLTQAVAQEGLHFAAVCL